MNILSIVSPYDFDNYQDYKKYLDGLFKYPTADRVIGYLSRDDIILSLWKDAFDPDRPKDLTIVI